jgi:hypothetical protein
LLLSCLVVVIGGVVIWEVRRGSARVDQRFGSSRGCRCRRESLVSLLSSRGVVIIVVVRCCCCCCRREVLSLLLLFVVVVVVVERCCRCCCCCCCRQRSLLLLFVLSLLSLSSKREKLIGSVGKNLYIAVLRNV